MYTGIVQGTESVLSLNKKDGFSTIVISNDNHFFDDIAIGASVAIDGTCLTVTQFSENRLTNLSKIKVGDFLNYEIDQTTRTIVDTLSRMLLKK
ncbi:hypothetical protein ID850_02015 [Xenorhabdus sp. Flor]|uniref:hypothetical protein n=1 Tax=Xenorhabdus cabanillasii TaxID=351673 RepID=UPI0019C35139|nr:hypothetical protein [Xenorhabdus sp. Flor]MBD2813565.1 hypothetical protein [Xenorhabdus sp. Flor]